MYRGSSISWHGVLAGCALSGCNAMLGIAEPSDTLLDGGVRSDESPVVVDSGVEEDAGSLAPNAFARARWPMPNAPASGLPNAQSYASEVDGVVLDERTGLEWQAEVDDRGRSFEEAEAYCASLSLDSGGFRLPSRIELTSLLDLTRASPAIDEAFFPETPPARFWTASPYAGAGGRAWAVSFSFSTFRLSAEPVGESLRARCVRSGDGEVPRALEVDTLLVRDPATGLSWERKPPGALLSFDEAAARCADLDGGGFRLPSLKELHTLVDETAARPAIDGEAFPGTPSDAFWTSSHVANFPEYTWTVSFLDGSDVWVSEGALAHARCVRSEQ